MSLSTDRYIDTLNRWGPFSAVRSSRVSISDGERIGGKPETEKLFAMISEMLVIRKDGRRLCASGFSAYSTNPSLIRLRHDLNIRIARCCEKFSMLIHVQHFHSYL